MPDGFLNIYKPSGITSMDVIRNIKTCIGPVKAGHCGTLDPLAEGVLPIALGRASRLVEYVLHESKVYWARIQLGQTTDTFDAEGNILNSNPTTHIQQTTINDILPRYIGNINQTPPLYSALKKDGKPLYKYARSGHDISVPQRMVSIFDITFLQYEEPYLDIRIHCGAGTYIRSLANDIGQSLKCGAHLNKLIREESGGFEFNNAIPLSNLITSIHDNPSALQDLLIALDEPIKYMPKLAVSHNTASKLRNGKQIPCTPFSGNYTTSTTYRAYDPNGHFLAVVSYQPSKPSWKPLKVFN
tara:strand:- start:15079 stop:15978 length:900 start_codon:yes stop_codon:yes gene_type:complete